MLQDAGWVENDTWENEVELSGMPNKSEVGYADYVLYIDGFDYVAPSKTKTIIVDSDGDINKMVGSME